MHRTYLSMVRAYARGLGIPRGTVWHYARRGWDARLPALDVAVQLRRRAQAGARTRSTFRENAAGRGAPDPRGAGARAGYHSDTRAWVRLYVENRVSRKVADEQWRASSSAAVRRQARSEARALDLVRSLLEAFPPLDPASEFYDDDVNGADLVEWISEHWAADARALLDRCA